MINDIPCEDPEIIKAWDTKLGMKEPPSSARFVDGGILSNFPINLFYNPNIHVPRLPTFGIDLDDAQPENKSMHAAGWSLFGYMGRMFNTIRFYYDKDFLLKNRVYEKGIGKIDVHEYNWLNFFLKKEDKLNMLVLGAKAATEFLLNFNWQEYKEARTEMQEQMTSANTKPDAAKASANNTTSINA